MTELTPRAPRRRTYYKDGGRAEVDVNANGVVECSEELFDVLLRIAGYYETTEPVPGVETLPLTAVGAPHTHETEPADG